MKKAGRLFLIGEGLVHENLQSVGQILTPAVRGPYAWTTSNAGARDDITNSLL